MQKIQLGSSAIGKSFKVAGSVDENVSRYTLPWGSNGLADVVFFFFLDDKLIPAIVYSVLCRPFSPDNI